MAIKRSNKIARRGIGKPRREAVPAEPERPKRVAVPPLDGEAPTISKRIDALVAHVTKQFGAGSIARLGDDLESVIGTFPTGIPSLDRAIGVGGWPLAKVCQISGGPSVGKSALVKKLIAQAQSNGVVPYFIDGEQSKDTPERYASLDISTRNVAWTEELFLEDAFKKIEAAIQFMKRSTEPSIVFIDSLMMPLKSSLDTDYDEERRRAARASFLSENLGKLIANLKDTKIGIVFVNQIRTRANAMPFQDPNYEPGGNALAHWSHLILRLTPVGRIGRGETSEGIKTKVTVRKSKISRPFLTATIDILFDGTIRESESQES